MPISDFTLGMCLGGLVGLLGVLVSVFAGLPRTVLSNITVMAVPAALAVNAGWAVEVLSEYSPDLRWAFPGLSGFGLALAVVVWLRAVLTPHEEYVQVLLSTSIGFCSVPLGYLAFLMGGLGAIPAATVTGFASAWLALMVMRGSDEGPRGGCAAAGAGCVTPVLLIIPLTWFFTHVFLTLMGN